MKKSNKTLALFCLLSLFHFCLTAATFNSAQSGNWNASNTWIEAGTPGANDNIIIHPNHKVMLSGNAYTHHGDITILENAELIANTGNNNNGFTFDGDDFHVFGILTLPFPDKDLILAGNSHFWGHPSAIIFVSDDWIVRDQSETIINGICVEVDDDFHLEGTAATVCGTGGISIGKKNSDNTFNLWYGATTNQFCLQTNIYRGEGGSCISLVDEGKGNQIPVANDDKANTSKNLATTIDILNLGTADHDPDNDQLSIFSLGSDPIKQDRTTQAGGQININDNGSPNDPSDDFVEYTPPVDFIGLDQFDYIITDQNGAYASATVFIEVANALPVELIEFRASTNDCRVLLEWATASEINNEYFELERSVDGLQFDYLAIVEGAGNSNQIINYSSIDAQPNAANYYRLKQVDFDGQFVYSDIIYVASDCRLVKENIEALTLFPNPVIEQFVHLRFDVQKTEQTPLIVSDVSGKIWIQQPILIQQGQNQQTIQLQGLPAGTYFLKIGKHLKKFIKQT